MSATPALTALGDERFVSLTTFRRSGQGVATAVWVARDGDALVVTTPAGSGKVKRLRNNGRVDLRPCSRTGQVREGVAPVTGVARIAGDEHSEQRRADLIRKKYGLEYKIIMAVERLSRRGNSERLILLITAS